MKSTETDSMLDEINEQSTPEEVSAYVEKVVEEVEKDRAGEQKSDAQIASEHAGKPADDKHNETPAETDSGRETAPTGEDTAKAETANADTGDEGASWWDDDLKAEVAAYGIDESDLADFANREELDRALRIFDKTALEAGRKALAETAETEGDGEKGSVRDEKGRFAKKEEAPKTDPPPDTGTQEGQYEIALDAEVYDDELVAEFTRMRDHYESKLSSLESRVDEVMRQFSEQQGIAEDQAFDDAVDKLNMPKLFGKTGSESQAELQRRQDLMVQCKAQQVGLQQLTGRFNDIHSLVGRVVRFAFPEEFDKQKLKQQTRKISRQSNGRQGGGTTRPQDPREDPRDEADRLYRELERA